MKSSHLMTSFLILLSLQLYLCEVLYNNSLKSTANIQEIEIFNDDRAFNLSSKNKNFNQQNNCLNILKGLSVQSPLVYSQSGWYTVCFDYQIFNNQDELQVKVQNGKNQSKIQVLDISGRKELQNLANKFTEINEEFQNQWNKKCLSFRAFPGTKIQLVLEGIQGGVCVKNLQISDENTKNRKNLNRKKTQIFCLGCSKEFSLDQLKTAIMNIWADVLERLEIKGKSIFFAPKLLNTQENGVDKPNKLKISSKTPLQPHFRKIVSFQLFLVGDWRNFTLSLIYNNKPIYLLKGDLEQFQKICKISTKNQKCKVFNIEIPLDDFENNFEFSFEPSSQLVDQSYGIRQFQVQTEKCCENCRECLGPSQLDCLQCGENSQRNLAECQCRLGFENIKEKNSLRYQKLDSYDISDDSDEEEETSQQNEDDSEFESESDFETEDEDDQGEQGNYGNDLSENESWSDNDFEEIIHSDNESYNTNLNDKDKIRWDGDEVDPTLIYSQIKRWNEDWSQIEKPNKKAQQARNQREVADQKLKRIEDEIETTRNKLQKSKQYEKELQRKFEKQIQVQSMTEQAIKNITLINDIIEQLQNQVSFVLTQKVFKENRVSELEQLAQEAEQEAFLLETEQGKNLTSYQIASEILNEKINQANRLKLEAEQKAREVAKLNKKLAYEAKKEAQEIFQHQKNKIKQLEKNSEKKQKSIQQLEDQMKKKREEIIRNNQIVLSNTIDQRVIRKAQQSKKAAQAKLETNQKILDSLNNQQKVIFKQIEAQQKILADSFQQKEISKQKADYANNLMQEIDKKRQKQKLRELIERQQEIQRELKERKRELEENRLEREQKLREIELQKLQDLREKEQEILENQLEREEELREMPLEKIQEYNQLKKLNNRLAELERLEDVREDFLEEFNMNQGLKERMALEKEKNITLKEIKIQLQQENLTIVNDTIMRIPFERQAEKKNLSQLKPISIFENIIKPQIIDNKTVLNQSKQIIKFEDHEIVRKKKIYQYENQTLVKIIKEITSFPKNNTRFQVVVKSQLIGDKLIKRTIEELKIVNESVVENSTIYLPQKDGGLMTQYKIKDIKIIPADVNTGRELIFVNKNSSVPIVLINGSSVNSSRRIEIYGNFTVKIVTERLSLEKNKSIHEQNTTTYKNCSIKKEVNLNISKNNQTVSLINKQTTYIGQPRNQTILMTENITNINQNGTIEQIIVKKAFDQKNKTIDIHLISQAKQNRTIQGDIIKKQNETFIFNNDTIQQTSNETIEYANKTNVSFSNIVIGSLKNKTIMEILDINKTIHQGNQTTKMSVNQSLLVQNKNKEKTIGKVEIVNGTLTQNITIVINRPLIKVRTNQTQTNYSTNITIYPSERVNKSVVIQPGVITQKKIVIVKPNSNLTNETFIQSTDSAIIIIPSWRQSNMSLVVQQGQSKTNSSLIVLKNQTIFINISEFIQDASVKENKIIIKSMENDILNTSNQSKVNVTITIGEIIPISRPSKPVILYINQTLPDIQNVTLRNKTIIYENNTVEKIKEKIKILKNESIIIQSNSTIIDKYNITKNKIKTIIHPNKTVISESDQISENQKNEKQTLDKKTIDNKLIISMKESFEPIIEMKNESIFKDNQTYTIQTKIIQILNYDRMLIISNRSTLYRNKSKVIETNRTYFKGYNISFMAQSLKNIDQSSIKNQNVLDLLKKLSIKKKFQQEIKIDGKLVQNSSVDFPTIYAKNLAYQLRNENIDNILESIYEEIYLNLNDNKGRQLDIDKSNIQTCLPMKQLDQIKLSSLSKNLNISSEQIQCLRMNQQYQKRVRMNYFTEYDRQMNQHILAVTLDPHYQELSKCYDLFLHSINKPERTTNQGLKFQMMMIQQYDVIVASIPQEKLLDYGCNVEEYQKFFEYDCEFRLDFVNIVNQMPDMQFFLPFKVKLHKTTFHKVDIVNRPIVNKLNVSRNQIQPNITAFVCENSTCLGQKPSRNYTIYDKIYLKIEIGSKSLRKIYHVAARSMLMECSNSDFVPLEFKPINISKGFSIYQTRTLLTGNCSIHIESELIESYSKNITTPIQILRFLPEQNQIKSLVKSSIQLETVTEDILILAYTLSNILKFSTILIGISLGILIFEN